MELNGITALLIFIAVVGMYSIIGKALDGGDK